MALTKNTFITKKNNFKKSQKRYIICTSIDKSYQKLERLTNSI